jgi:hypothetical protein
MGNVKIYITEEQARRLFEIKEDNPEKEIINEMALSLKDYKNKVESLRVQIVQNWCLCEYCYKYDYDNPNYNHWVVELKAYLERIKFYNIKGNANKEKVLAKVLIDECDLDMPSMIENIIRGKFKKEGINDKNIIGDICNAFANNIDNIISMLSNDEATVDDYLYAMFDVE